MFKIDYAMYLKLTETAYKIFSACLSDAWKFDGDHTCPFMKDLQYGFRTD